VFAAYCVLLHRYASQDEFVIGLASHRSDIQHPEVGNLVELLPIRVSLAARSTFTELLGDVARLEASARANADFPVDALVDKLRGDLDPSRWPIQTAFTVHAAASGDIASSHARFDLELGVVPTAGGTGLALTYDAELFAHETIERMASAFVWLLEAIAADPDRRVIDLPLLTPEERARVVVDFNATTRPFPAERIHDFVADQARRRPDAIAVEHDGRVLTYRELDKKANALAVHLQALGVAPDTAVGLYLERSPELIVSILRC